jgi:Fic family protein
MLTSIEVSLPPMIAMIEVRSTTAAETQAIGAVVRLDSSARGTELAALGHMLIRLESVASSKIEHIEAGVDDYARALAGSRANESATAMVAASVAIRDLIDSTPVGGMIGRESLLGAHAALMADDPHEHDFAGRFRTMQNWIGGSDYSPRDALFVPPPPDTVDAYIEDLLLFANRDDLPPITQAAIVHAQFESIHPFTDGNGRIGRALIQAVLRRRGITRAVVVPLASALVADQAGYFEMLTAYRSGDIAPIVEGITTATDLAAESCLSLPERLSEVRHEWRTLVRTRAGSTAEALMDLLTANPVVSTASVESLLGVSYTAANTALSVLTDAGILSPVSERKRDRVFVATEVMAELDSLERAIRRRRGERPES